MGGSNSKSDTPVPSLAQEEVHQHQQLQQVASQAQVDSQVVTQQGLAPHQPDTPQIVAGPHASQPPPTPSQRWQPRSLTPPATLHGAGPGAGPYAAAVTCFNDDDAIASGTSAAAAQPEPDPDVSVDGPVSVSTRVEYSSLARGETQNVFGLVTLQAAAAPEANTSIEGNSERQPMDILCVLDVSGSMQGNKINQVKDSVRFIIEQADPKDRVSIVRFNSSASRVIRLRKMSAEGKDEATVATLRLSADGGTSISAGLDTAISIMEQRRQRNKVSAILLLTDGQDSSTRSRIPALVARASQAHCSVYAFGFGADHDAALLSEIAEHARTPFTYMEDTKNIREAFAGAVGGLSSIVAQCLQLTLKCSVLLKSIETPFTVQRSSEREAIVEIPDIFGGERRDILVELAVPAEGEGSGETVLLEASARYTDLQRNCMVQTAWASMDAVRVDEPQPELEPDEEVSAQRERVEVTRALQEAAKQSDEGHFEAACRVIDSVEDGMRQKKRTKMSDALTQELTDARHRMQSRSSWEHGGRAEVRDATQMHQMQRCTNLAQSPQSYSKKCSKAMYVSPTSVAWISNSKGSRG